MSCEMSNLYAGFAGILLQIKGKLTIVDFKVKVKIRGIPLSVSSILYYKIIWIDAM